MFLNASYIFGIFRILQKDSLAAEVEKEKQLRLEAEQKLSEMTAESHSSQVRLQALQDDFNK